MIERGAGGKIVNIASVAGLRGAPPEVMNAVAVQREQGRRRRASRATSRASGRGTGSTSTRSRPGWFPSEMSQVRARRSRRRAPDRASRSARFGGAGRPQGRGRLPRLGRVGLRHRAHARGRRRRVGRKRAEVPWARSSTSASAPRSQRDAPRARRRRVEGGVGRGHRGGRLLVRRAGGGVIHARHALARARVPGAPGRRTRRGSGFRAGCLPRRARRPRGVRDGAREGETMGAASSRTPPPGLALQIAEELAKIHAIPRERVPFLAPATSSSA